MLSIPEFSLSIDLREFKLHTMIEDLGYFPSVYTLRSSSSKFFEIKRYLQRNDKVMGLFRKTCFGHLLDLSDNWMFPGLLCHYLLLNSVKSKKDFEMWFIVGHKPVMFGMNEFALVTGLNCGPVPKANDETINKGKEFCAKILEGRNYIRGKDLEDKLHDNDYSARDKLKICLVLCLHYFLMAMDCSKTVEASWLEVVGDIDHFNSFPWGKMSFQLTIKSLQTRKLEKAYKNWQGNDNLQKFNIQGFLWAFMVWAYEAIPLFSRVGYGLISSNKDSIPPIPRMLRYELRRSSKWEYEAIESLLQTNEVVVHPFLIPTKREMREQYVVSLEELEDVSDENIDRLKKKLEGVTMLTSHIVSPEHHASEMNYLITLSPMPEWKEECKGELKSTITLPPSSPFPHNSEIVELLKAISDKQDLLNTKVDLLSKRVDFAVDKLGELRKEFHMAQQTGEQRTKEELEEKNDREEKEKSVSQEQNVEKPPHRERKRSHLIKSPYTGGYKKAKINEEKMDPSQQMFMPISEDKKRAFYDWYNGNDESKRAKCFHGEYKRQFFADILTVGAWVDDSHLQEGLSLIRTK